MPAWLTTGALGGATSGGAHGECLLAVSCGCACACVRETAPALSRGTATKGGGVARDMRMVCRCISGTADRCRCAGMAGDQHGPAAARVSGRVLQDGRRGESARPAVYRVRGGGSWGEGFRLRPMWMCRACGGRGMPWRRAGERRSLRAVVGYGLYGCTVLVCSSAVLFGPNQRVSRSRFTCGAGGARRAGRPPPRPRAPAPGGVCARRRRGARGAARRGRGGAMRAAQSSGLRLDSGHRG